jgi:hypothetical protein
MQNRVRSCFLLLVGALLLVAVGYAQDQPSLGDVARQARQEKQKNAQNKDAQGKPLPASKTPLVITNESLPDHNADDTPSPAPDNKSRVANDDSSPEAAQGKMSADEWKSRIQAQKSLVDGLQSNIDELSQSIQFAPGNCVAGCVEWNEHQKQKQQEVEQMRSKLQSAKKQLEDMQDSARKQGYGSSVYEP